VSLFAAVLFSAAARLLRICARRDHVEPAAPENRLRVQERAMKAATMNSGCQILAWRRMSALRDHFALYAGEHRLAVLTIGGLVGPVAELHAGKDHRFVFSSDGLARSCVRVCDAETKAVVAMYERDRQGVGGTLRLANGGQLRWTRAGGLRSSGRVFVNADGHELVRFATDGTVKNFVPEDAATTASPELLLVLALGWLLIVLARDRPR
jgi:hypothetical protein